MRASSPSPLIAILLSCALAASASAGPPTTGWGAQSPPPATNPPGAANQWGGATVDNVNEGRCPLTTPLRLYLGNPSNCIGATSVTQFPNFSDGGGLWTYQLIAEPPAPASWIPAGGSATVWVRGPATPQGTGCAETVLRGVQKVQTFPSSDRRAPQLSIGFSSVTYSVACTSFPS